MHRFPSLILVFAVLMMTPVGVYTCGSLANSLIVMRGDDVLPTAIGDESVPNLQMTETAVTSYLFSPMAAANNTAKSHLSLFVVAVITLIIPPQINKRKPPTPPPTPLI